MSWSGVLGGLDNAIDAVESWIAGQSFWVQVPLLLAVLLPACWWLAGLIDRTVDRILWPFTRREARRTALHPAGRRRTAPAEDVARDARGDRSTGDRADVR